MHVIRTAAAIRTGWPQRTLSAAPCVWVEPSAGPGPDTPGGVPLAVIAPRVCEAIAVAFGSEFSGTDPVLRPSQFADVQANAALALAKRIGLPPREVAGRILDHLDLDDLCSHIGVSGPGFLNLTLREEWIEAAVSAMASDERLGVPLETPQRIPIDYSAPNVAKETHVGHLRTTVVGDALARILETSGSS